MVSPRTARTPRLAPRPRRRISIHHVMLHPASLEELVKISKSPCRKDVRSLWIHTHHLSSHHQDLLNPDSPSTKHYGECLAEQERFMKEGKALETLCKALSNFSNCRSIILTDNENYSPLAIRQLSKDIGDRPPAGLASNIGFLPGEKPFLEEHNTFLNRAVGVAVALTAAFTRIEELAISVGGLAGRDTHSVALDVLMESMNARPGIQEQLKRLALVVDPNSERATAPSCQPFGDFLNKFQNLSALNVRFSGYDNQVFNKTLGSLRLEHLSFLGLSGVWCASPDTSIQVITNHRKTLRKVVVRDFLFRQAADLSRSKQTLEDELQECQIEWSHCHDLESLCSREVKPYHPNEPDPIPVQDDHENETAGANYRYLTPMCLRVRGS